MRPRVLLGLIGLLLPALAAVPVSTASADITGGRSTAPAKQALDRAQGIWQRPGASARRAAPSSARDTTMLLRDLAVHLDGLDAADRRTAQRILARPTDGASDPQGFGYADPASALSSCSEHVCVHWVPDQADADAPPLADVNGTDDGDGVPDQVELTGQVFEQVWAAEVDTMGYTAPMPDGTAGGDGRLDVYLMDSGGNPNAAIYGYCAADSKAPHAGNRYAGYCAVDDDFSTTQFSADPLISLQVTAAHEFFHAVQFGYDRTEDRWFMESTAAWIEDEVFDDANDNYQYFGLSPLRYPWLSLNRFTRDVPQYGSWVFFKLLSETYGVDAVRTLWERTSQDGQYSLSALRSMLAGHGTTLTDFFARFGAVNHYPARIYSEGRAYPKAALAGTITLSKRHPAQKPLTGKQEHLSNATFRYRPGSTLTGHRDLRMVLDMATQKWGMAATAVVQFRDGRISRRPFRLDRSGAGHMKVPFTRSKVTYVELTLTNASEYYKVATTFSAKAVR